MLFILLACFDSNTSQTDQTQSATTQDTSSTQPNAQPDTAGEQDTAATMDTGTVLEEDPIDCPELGASVLWEEERVHLTIESFAEQTSYFFGFAQTHISGSLQWTGEDCHKGFSTQSGEEYLYCHPAGMGSNAGVQLEYGAPYDDVQEGLNTHFVSKEFDGQVSYVIKDAISGCCWVWGENPSYFESLNCTHINETQSE